MRQSWIVWVVLALAAGCQTPPQPTFDPFMGRKTPVPPAMPPNVAPSTTPYYEGAPGAGSPVPVPGVTQGQPVPVNQPAMSQQTTLNEGLPGSRPLNSIFPTAEVPRPSDLAAAAAPRSQAQPELAGRTVPARTQVPASPPLPHDIQPPSGQQVAAAYRPTQVVPPTQPAGNKFDWQMPGSVQPAANTNVADLSNVRPVNHALMPLRGDARQSLVHSHNETPSAQPQVPAGPAEPVDPFQGREPANPGRVTEDPYQIDPSRIPTLATQPATPAESSVRLASYVEEQTTRTRTTPAARPPQFSDPRQTMPAATPVPKQPQTIMTLQGSSASAVGPQHSASIARLPVPTRTATAPRASAAQPMELHGGAMTSAQPIARSQPAATSRAHSRTARIPPSYGYDPQYHWLRGKLEYSQFDGRWKLRYIPIDGQTDHFGGSVVLNTTSPITNFRAGQTVTVFGQVGRGDGAENDFAAPYDVARIEP